MTVWKYPLELYGPNRLLMPSEARLVHVAMQSGLPTLWALADPKAPKVERTFVVRGTGEPVPTDERHVGSMLDGPYVWHVFEVVP